MKHTLFRVAALAAAIGLAGPAMAEGVQGTWLRQEGVARVRIAPCGATLCGTIVWLKTTDGPGQVGQRVLFGMTANGANTWTGSAFNPEDGNTYSGALTVSGNRLVTTGCALGGLVCKSVTWSRFN